MRILWVEDMPTFYEETKEILEMFAEDMGLVVGFRYVQNVSELMENMQNEEKGFKLYDIYFIDYTLSNGVVGDSVIKALRKVDVDADVLFYSSEHEKDIRSTIVDDLNSFQGVYIANRDNFEEKSTFLIKKNGRRLLGLNSIRGVLMDQTSENDFTVNSYIIRKFCQLKDKEKTVISKMLIEYITQKSKDLKYRVFQQMIKFLGDDSFNDYSLDTYLNETVKERNKLAHKKLELCKTQQYILYYDTIDQKEKRKCPNTCDNHTDEYKISIQDWNRIRKNVIAFGKCFDNVQKKLEE